MASHAKPFDTEAEGEATDLLRIVTNGRQDVWIDHARAAELDPVVVPTHVGFNTWLGKRKERGTEADVHIVAQVAGREQTQHALQVSHRDFLVHQQEPRGYIDEANAKWLMDRIARDSQVKTDSELEVLIKHLADIKNAWRGLGKLARWMIGGDSGDMSWEE